MIKFQATATSAPAKVDVASFGKEHGLSAKEASRIFLKLGPSASSDEVLEEAKLYAEKAKASK